MPCCDPIGMPFPVAVSRNCRLCGYLNPHLTLMRYCWAASLHECPRFEICEGSNVSAMKWHTGNTFSSPSFLGTVDFMAVKTITLTINKSRFCSLPPEVFQIRKMWMQQCWCPFTTFLHVYSSLTVAGGVGSMTLWTLSNPNHNGIMTLRVRFPLQWVA